MRVVGDGAEGLDRPRGCVLRGLGAEFVAPRVGGLGAAVEPRPVVVGGVARDEVGRGGDVRGEPAGEGLADPVVQHLGQRAGVVEVAG